MGSLTTKQNANLLSLVEEQNRTNRKVPGTAGTETKPNRNHIVLGDLATQRMSGPTSVMASQHSRHRTLPPGFVECHHHVPLSCHRMRPQCAFRARCPGTFGQGPQHHLRPSRGPTTFSETGLSNIGHSSIIHKESVCFAAFPYLLDHATSKL